MNLNYSARKRLSRLVDRHADEAYEFVLENEESEAVATIASNAVHDRLVEDDDLIQLVALADGAEDLSESRERSASDSVARDVEDAWFSLEEAISTHCDRRRKDIVADVVDREVIRA